MVTTCLYLSAGRIAATCQSARDSKLIYEFKTSSFLEGVDVISETIYIINGR